MKTIVIREIGGDDSKCWAIGHHGQAFEGKWQRPVIFIDGWYEKEDDARAGAHRANHPDELS